ncbi:MAG: helix-turn-helix domain-containing protein [Acidobacteriota bacterium]
MTSKRNFSTRELAQMWNVSESTIKRWADAGELYCYRTPGGHRKFYLEDICSFQRKRGFEATGLLTTEKWEDPEIEDSLNRKNFQKVRQLVHYLAIQNQRNRIKDLLERLYIRGMGIVDLYDEILVPILKSSQQTFRHGDLALGQERLLRHNLEEAMSFLFPQLIRRRQNGKTGLCAAPDDFCTIPVNAISRILEVEGWDCLNLGVNVPFPAMAEIVKEEPVNLVCVVSSNPGMPICQEFECLSEAADSYRIPVVLVGAGFQNPKLREQLPHDEYFPDFRSFHHYVLYLSR